MATNGKRPTHRIKYEIKGEEGKTVRTLKVGALWEPNGNRPGRIHLEAIPTSFNGWLTFWPVDEEKDEVQE